jgi:hypothetical protein
VLARDHTRDRIDCSAGRDRAYVDGDSSIRPDKLVRCEFIQLG